jgi:FdhD protein
MKGPVVTHPVLQVQGGVSTKRVDILVTEEPLEIRLGHGPEEDRKEVRLSVTMRTPGNDEELAMGFLFTEGIINSPAEVLRVVPCENVKEEERGNVIRAELHPEVELDPAKWHRNFYTSSSCGVCGKTSIEAVRTQCKTRPAPFGEADPKVITALPDRMREAQTVFKHTGGIHAAALFDREGNLLILREDVGRHNAVDKVIGTMLGVQSVEAVGSWQSASAVPDTLYPIPGTSNSNHQPPITNCILLVSGRAGFELVQKCLMAGIPLMAAVGAPSSLAVQLAKEGGLTLIGFLRGERFNVYADGVEPVG